MPALVLILFIAAESVLKTHLNTFIQPYGVAALILCIAYFLYYFTRNPEGSALWENFTSQTPLSKWNVVIVATILLLGCFLRFWKLGSLFDGMTYDEAYKGLDAISIRQFGERPIFLDWNGGREALIGYAVAATQSFLDYTSLSVRVVTAFAGCISLLFFYLFTRTIFSNNIALVSTFLLAVSKWHIIHSRYGVRAGLYPAFELGTLYFLSRGLNSDKKRTGSLIVAGLIGGLGLYTYIAYRIFPFVLIAFLLERAVRNNLGKQIRGILAAVVVSLMIIAPLAGFYMENTQSLTDRMKRTQVWKQTGKDGEGPVKLILDSTVRSLGMFTYRGDAIARHNVNEEPMLSPFMTPFFILGFVLVIIHFRKNYAKFLLFYFFLTLLPGILSVGAPNVPRVFGCLPVAILFTAFGLCGAAQILNRYGRMLPKILIAIVLTGSLLTGTIDALVRQPAILDSLSPRLAALWGMDRDQANVARLANQLGERCEIYLPPQFFFHSTIEYLTYSKSKHKLITPQTDLRRSSSSDKILVIFIQPEQINPWWLRDDEGKRFYKWWKQVYQIEPRAMRTSIRRTYDPPFTKTSDWRILKMLETEHPEAKRLRFENFSAIVLRLHPR